MKTSPSGTVLDGSLDTLEAPRAREESADPDDDGVRNEIPTSLVDFMEFYLLNYFKAGRGERTATTVAGRETFQRIGCAGCHVPALTVNHDRRVADVEIDSPLWRPRAGTDCSPSSALWCSSRPTTRPPTSTRAIPTSRASHSSATA